MIYRCLQIKNCSCRLRKLIDLVDNEVIKNTKFNRTKVNHFEKEISDAITLIHP